MRSETEIKQYLEALVQKYTRTSGEAVDVQASFEMLGLDSIDLVSMSAELEDYLQAELSPLVLHEHPSIELLVPYLADLSA